MANIPTTCELKTEVTMVFTRAHGLKISSPASANRRILAWESTTVTGLMMNAMARVSCPTSTTICTLATGAVERKMERALTPLLPPMRSTLASSRTAKCSLVSGANATATYSAVISITISRRVLASGTSKMETKSRAHTSRPREFTASASSPGRHPAISPLTEEAGTQISSLLFQTNNKVKLILEDEVEKREVPPC